VGVGDGGENVEFEEGVYLGHHVVHLYVGLFVLFGVVSADEGEHAGIHVVIYTFEYDRSACEDALLEYFSCKFLNLEHLHFFITQKVFDEFEGLVLRVNH